MTDIENIYELTMSNIAKIIGDHATESLVNVVLRTKNKIKNGNIIKQWKIVNIKSTGGRGKKCLVSFEDLVRISIAISARNFKGDLREKVLGGERKILIENMHIIIDENCIRKNLDMNLKKFFNDHSKNF